MVCFTLKIMSAVLLSCKPRLALSPPTHSAEWPTHLDCSPVQPRGDVQSLWILDHFTRDDAGSVRRPPVEAFAERPLATTSLDLPVPVGYIVSDGVSQDAVQSLGLGHVGATLADDNDQLALVVETRLLLGHLVHRDRVRWACQRSNGLILYWSLVSVEYKVPPGGMAYKQHWVPGNRQLGLGGCQQDCHEGFPVPAPLPRRRVSRSLGPDTGLSSHPP